MNIICSRELQGIKDQSTEKFSYWHRFRQFHESPIVKMFYEFVSIIHTYTR